MRRVLSRLSALALLSLLTAAPASAAVCNVAGVTAAGAGGSASASACFGQAEGNDIGAKGALLPGLLDGAIFGLAGDWSLFGASDGTGPVSAAGDRTGAWSVAAGAPLPRVFVVSLKASDSFSAFLFKDIAFTVTGGAFDTGLAGLRTGGKDGQKNVAGLSHLSIFTLAPPPTPEPERVPAPVPLPAAVWLLAIGVGGLLLAGRRRAA